MRKVSLSFFVFLFCWATILTIADDASAYTYDEERFLEEFIGNHPLLKNEKEKILDLGKTYCELLGIFKGNAKKMAESCAKIDLMVNEMVEGKVDRTIGDDALFAGMKYLCPEWEKPFQESLRSADEDVSDLLGKPLPEPRITQPGTSKPEITEEQKQFVKILRYNYPDITEDMAIELGDICCGLLDAYEGDAKKIFAGLTDEPGYQLIKKIYPEAETLITLGLTCAVNHLCPEWQEKFKRTLAEMEKKAKNEKKVSI